MRRITCLIIMIAALTLTACGSNSSDDTKTTRHIERTLEAESRTDLSDENTEQYFEFDKDTEKADELSDSSILIRVEDCPKTVGDMTFSVAEENGYNIFSCTKEGKEVLSIDTEGNGILMHGNDLYFLNEDVTWVAIYKYNYVTRKGSNIYYVYDDEKRPALVGYQNGKIIFVEGYEPGTLCQYDEESETKETLLDEVSSARQFGNNLVCIRSWDGGWFALKTYNLISGEMSVLTETALSYDIISDKLYYVAVDHYNEDTDFSEVHDYICDVYSSDLDGSNVTVLLEDERILGEVEEINESNIKVKRYDADTDSYEYSEIEIVP